MFPAKIDTTLLIMVGRLAVIILTLNAEAETETEVEVAIFSACDYSIG